MAARKTDTMIDFFKPKRPSTILGLSFDGNRLEAAVVRRSNGSLHVHQSVMAPLALSLLSGDPQLVGRELRNHLDQAGIRERRCAVCLPLNWVLTLQAKLPDLPEEDIASFLEIESERGFPSGHENLYLATSRAKAANGEQFATMMGIPRNHLASVQAVLKAAQLKPLTFSLGITALAGGGRQKSDAGLTLALASHGIDLQVSAGGGIAALRSLDSAVETEGVQKRIDADLVMREIRITLGQLPPPLATEVRTARIFGRGESARQFVSDIARRMETTGLRVELMERATDAELGANASPEIALSPAVAMAASFLREAAPGPEFLPPRVSAYQQMLTSSKFSSQKLVWAGSAGGAIALFIAGAFLVQAWQISRLESQFNEMSPKVTELTVARDKIRQFRPWYDRSFAALQIMRAMAQAFPEEGNVTAKSLEIRDLLSVTCSGNARDNQSYLRLLDQLRTAPDVSDLKTESLRGQSPSLQFTLNFQWGEGGANGN
jgi:hypothetical protein